MSLKKQATSGFVWTFAQQFGNQLIGFVISIILARLLLPEEFGLIGMIAIFVAVSRVLIESGLTQSIIRSDNLDQEDYSTVFFFNLIASILIYLVVYLLAPFIAEFYNQEILTGIIRLFCLSFIIDAFASVQLARLTKLLNFKTQALVAIPSTVFAGIVGVSLAYLGYGVWSLVWSNIASSIVFSAQIWLYSKWTPSLVFNVFKFKKHFNFGYKISLSSLLNKIFDNIYLIIIGKFFSASQVGYYTRAETMKQLPVKNISSALNKITFPLFASIKDDNERLKRVYRQLMQMVVYVIAPVVIFLAVLAEPIFRLLFTEKWLPAVPFFQILCITGILYPIHAYNLNVLKVKGRSDLYLRLAIIKKAFTVVGILIGIQFGIYGLLYAQVILSFSSFFINAYYTDIFINYSAVQQFRDVFPIILVAIIAGASIYALDISLHEQLDFIRILSGGFVGVLVYLLLSFILNLKSMYEIKKLVIRS